MTDTLTPDPPTRQISSRGSGLIVVIAGAAALGALYWLIYSQQSHGTSPGAVAMPDMGMTDMTTYWSFPILQASGLVGLVTAWISVGLGLQQSRKSSRFLGMDYRTIDQVHRQVALLTLGLVIVHVVATAFDAMGDSWRSVLWFNGWATDWPDANWGYNIGVFAFYTLLLLGPTFYLRRRMGVNRWKFLHRFILVFYVLSVWHALILGLDVAAYAWVRPVIWLAQIPLLWFLSRRFTTLAQANRAAGRGAIGYLTSMAIVVASYVAMVACLAIVVTGRSDFILTV